MTKSIKLKDYQKEAVKFGLKKTNCAFFIDPGMGKTAIVLTLLSILKRKSKIKKVLIIASINIMYETWPSEIKKWKQFNHFRFAILHGKDKDILVTKDADIFLINPEGLAWLATKKIDFDTLVIDESSKFKNPASRRFKTLKKWIPRFSRRFIMTGTPTPQGLMDLFSQIFIVDNGATFGQYITHFRDKYFYLVNPRFYKYQLKTGADKVIEKKVAPLAYVLKNTKIKKPVFNYIKVTLPEDCQKTYNMMEKQLFSIIEGEKILAASAASAYNKCHQMANGALYVEDQIKLIHDKKISALGELEAELQGKPLLVGYTYLHDLKRLKTWFKNAPHIGGDVKITERKKIIADWNAGKLPLLLGQIGSISHGLNLQGSGCRDVCYYSLTDDLDAYEQFYRRVYGRQGSKALVRVHHIITKNTVDQAILKRLRSKNKKQLTLLEALEKYRDTRKRAFLARN